MTAKLDPAVREWYKKIGRKGGKVKSEAKTKANRKKGEQIKRMFIQWTANEISKGGVVQGGMTMLPEPIAYVVRNKSSKRPAMESLRKEKKYLKRIFR